MSDNLNYRIFPQEASYKTVTLDESQRKNIEGLKFDLFDGGCLLLIAIFVVTALFTVNIFGFLVGVVIALVGAVVAVNLISSAIKSSKAAAIERKSTDSANQSEIQRVTKDAEYLTSSLTSTYNSSTKLANEVPNCLNEASLWLQTAEHEFQSNAFAPFWDAVEQAAIWLGDYNYKTNQIAQNANEYYQRLNGQNHTFPVFPVKLQTIPDASFVVNELFRITRLGQTNFHFANIWEHRRTRQEIVSGFRTLNDAVNNLGYTIENSISNLQDSISSDMAKVVEEQIRTRESVDRTRESIDKTRQAVDEKGAKIDKRLLEQNRMLDNIQHDREPKLKDIPSKR